MAKEEQIKTSIDLTGEKEYRAACTNINSSLREIGSEMKLTKAEFAADSRVTTMLVKSGLCKSQSDARNQVKAGAVLVADKKVDDLNATLAESDVPADGLLIQKGKKNFRRLFLA